LYGVKPVIIAVVLHALWNLGRTAMKTKPLAVAAMLAAAVNFLGVNELVVLFATGLMVALARGAIKGAERGRVSCFFGAFQALPLLGTAAPASASVTAFGLWPMFLFFVKVGSVLFGSGYVLLAFLRADLVDQWGWLSEAQLLDAIAVGQFTPGPVFTTATFIGYLLAGTPGAVLATVGIFLPAFVFVALSGPLIPRIRKSAFAGAVLDGINVASLSLMAVVTIQLGRVALIDWVTVLLLAASACLLIRFKVNSAWLVLGGALIGFLVTAWR
jgi:chromate transporter